MSRFSSLPLAGLALCASAALVACDSGTSPATAGSLSVALTDAPFPFDSVARPSACP